MCECKKIVFAYSLLWVFASASLMWAQSIRIRQPYDATGSFGAMALGQTTVCALSR